MEEGEDSVFSNSLWASWMWNWNTKNNKYNTFKFHLREVVMIEQCD